MGKKKTVQKQEAVQQQNVDKAAHKSEKKSKKTAQKQQPAHKEQKAAGKTKAIKKQQKPVKPAKEEKQSKPVEKVEKKAKAPKKQVQNLQVFTPEFYGRVNDFQTFYKQVLELKSSASDSNISDELSTVNNKVRESLQAASSKILRQELVSLEDWIQGEQKRLREQISTVEKCLEQTQKSLESTKAFTVDEVQNQLKPIRSRIAEKQSTLDSYATLLARSQGIYQEAPQEEEKKEVEKAEEENNQENNQDVEQQLDLNSP